MSAPRVAVRPAAAIVEIAWLLGYAGAGELPLYLDGKPNPERLLPCSRLAESALRLARLAERFDRDDSAEVAIGLPVTGGYVYDCTILHAWVKGGQQLRLAAQFTPAPSVVLKMGADGSERLLMWALKRPVSESKAALYNARLSYVLKAPRTRSAPEKLRVPMPGTFLRIGRARPAPVLVTRLSAETGHDVEKVAGGLREPPPKDAWRERKS